ncbi:MAG: hypothetical protein QXW57_04455, partial [Candidatus Micrarchaeaceae archaeon]
SFTEIVYSNITEVANYGERFYVTVNANPSVGGSTSPASGWYNAGTQITFSETPNSGSGYEYVFTGWSGTYSSSSPSFTETVNQPITETANYNEYYYLTMNAQYGLTTSPASGWYLSGSQVTISATGSSGSEFYSWSGTGSGSYSGSNNPVTITMNGPISETANAQYYLNVYVNSGSGSVSGSGWYTAGSVATASETPATGYHFVDWTNGATDSTYSFTMNGPNSIGANFEINTYTVTFQSSPVEGAPVTVNGNGETTPYSIVVDYGTTVTYSYGSPFSGGSGIQYVNPSPSSGSFTVTSTTTITASYTTQYYLTMVANPSSEGSVSPGSGWYNSGTQVSISASPNTGYHFVSWSGSGSGSYSGSNNPVTITMNSPISETANFAPNTYTVIFQSSPVEGAPVTVDGNSETTPYNISVIYGATVSYSYGNPFNGGSGVRYVNPSPASGSFTVTSSTTVTADYTTQYYLTMNAQPGLSVSPSSGWYNAGTQVSISATGSTGSALYSWVGTGNGSYTGTNNPATITMNSPISEIADVQYYLTMATNPSAGGIVSPSSGWYVMGAVVSIQATPNSGYVFNSWSGSGSGSYSGTNNPTSITMNNPISETADFTPTYTITFSQTGLSSSASGTVLTVDGNSYGYSQLPVSFTWVEGSQHSFAWSSPVSGGSGTQFVWQSTSGLSSSQSATITITGPGSITGNYGTQYYVSVSASPSSEGTVSPSSGWYNAGTQITFSETPNSGPGYQYAFDGWSGTYSPSLGVYNYLNLDHYSYVEVIPPTLYDPQTAPTGTFWYGPYISLGPGNYEVTFMLKETSSTNSQVLTLDVTSNYGTNTFASENIYGYEFAGVNEWTNFTLPFSLSASATDVEFRGVDFTEATGLYLYKVVLQQVPPVSSFTETVNQPITEIANYSVWSVQAWEGPSGSFPYQTTPTTDGVVFATGGFNSLDFSYGTPSYQGNSYYGMTTVPFPSPFNGLNSQSQPPYVGYTAYSTVNIQQAGNYQFNIETDDEMAVYINGPGTNGWLSVFGSNAWHFEGATGYSQTESLQAG